MYLPAAVPLPPCSTAHLEPLVCALYGVQRRAGIWALFGLIRLWGGQPWPRLAVGARGRATGGTSSRKAGIALPVRRARQGGWGWVGLGVGLGGVEGDGGVRVRDIMWGVHLHYPPSPYAPVTLRARVGAWVTVGATWLGLG